MILIFIRQIKNFKLGLSLGCDRCDKKEKYILRVETGPQQGNIYLVCEECMQDLHNNSETITIPVN